MNDLICKMIHLLITNRIHKYKFDTFSPNKIDQYCLTNEKAFRIINDQKDFIE
jgi:hypothetical protein